MKAAVISVGTELVQGEIVDTNSAWLARELAELGIDPIRHTTVGDDEAALAAAVTCAVALADIVIVTGGIGPTPDDITRQAIARVAGAPLVRDAAALAHIEGMFRSWGREMPPVNAIQADFPKGSEVIDNPRGTAPGFRITIKGTEIVVLPGVPSEMKAMWLATVRPALAGRGGGVLVTRTVNCFGRGEADITEVIKDLMAAGRNPLVGDTAEDAVIKVRIRARAATLDEALVLIAADKAEIRRRLGDAVFGEDDDTLGSVVAGELIARGLTVSVAESCTGGLVSARLTDISGISAAFTQGIVAYSNETKMRLVGVKPETLSKFGAVSDATARELAEGARRSAGADYGISATGIAGPAGGSLEKPVGLVYVAVASARGTTSRELRLRQTRDQIRDRAVKHLLNMLRLELAGR